MRLGFSNAAFTMHTLRDAVVTRPLCLTAAFLLHAPLPASCEVCKPFWVITGRDKGGAYRTFP